PLACLNALKAGHLDQDLERAGPETRNAWGITGLFVTGNISDKRETLCSASTRTVRRAARD
ncbi:hypothetical protein, partial [Paraburkholderia silvatlantica]|uniref:hypothetical protein n=1 Tax=Paraburkholderia silvatlantica TaxID=321895 RepID=UPI0036139530